MGKANAKPAKGASRQSINAYIAQKYGDKLGPNFATTLKVQLRRFVNDGKLVQSKGPSGSFRVNKDKLEKPKKKKAARRKLPPRRKQLTRRRNPLPRRKPLPSPRPNPRASLLERKLPNQSQNPRLATSARSLPLPRQRNPNQAPKPRANEPAPLVPSGRRSFPARLR